MSIVSVVHMEACKIVFPVWFWILNVQMQSGKWNSHLGMLFLSKEMVSSANRRLDLYMVGFQPGQPMEPTRN